MNKQKIIKKIRSISKNDWCDWINLGGYWYTIEEYDSLGVEMYLKSIEAPEDYQEIYIYTPYNRYSNDWLSKAEIDIYKPAFWRFDKSYYQYKPEEE